MRKRVVAAVVSITILGATGLIMGGVREAGACELALRPIIVDPPEAAVGDLVHVSGGPTFEVVPAADQASTTTVPGAPISTCPPTRPVTHQTLSFVQGDSLLVLAEVDGAPLDVDVVIPDGAAPGPATIVSASGGQVQIEITGPPAPPITRQPTFTG